MATEAYYREMDALYRIHEDLFHVEDAILRSAAARMHLAELTAESAVGALIAAILVALPIVISDSGLDWSSLPVIWSALVSLGLIVLMAVQIHRTRSTARDLRLARQFYKRTPLERRHDYALEQVFLNGSRIRILDELVPGLEAAGGDLSDPGTAMRVQRWLEIREDCRSVIRQLITESEDLQQKGTRSNDEHAELLDWAQPFLAEADERADGHSG